MQSLEKDLYFEIDADQWGEHGLVIKTSGMVGFERIDRKDPSQESFEISTWQTFMETNLHIHEEVYRQVAEYIQAHLLEPTGS